MNEEIKEILEDVKRHLDYVNDSGLKSIRDTEMEKMYNYITNLQTIEQQYSAILSENAELENKITNLQEEIDRLNNIINELEKYINDTENWYIDIVHSYIDKKPFIMVEKLSDKLKELKGEDKE